MYKLCDWNEMPEQATLITKFFINTIVRTSSDENNEHPFYSHDLIGGVP